MKFKFICVDIEADGPCPGLYSMVKLGAIVVEPSLNRTFSADFCPIEGSGYIKSALDSCNLTHEETLNFPKALIGINAFVDWLQTLDCKPMFVSDNNGFDWQFVNYYMWAFNHSNPFGHSSTNLGSLYKGLARDAFKNFKHLRKTKHTHNPLDDARGNAEAMLEMAKKISGLIS